MDTAVASDAMLMRTPAWPSGSSIWIRDESQWRSADLQRSTHLQLPSVGARREVGNKGCAIGHGAPGRLVGLMAGEGRVREQLLDAGDDVAAMVRVAGVRPGGLRGRGVDRDVPGEPPRPFFT